MNKLKSYFALLFVTGLLSSCSSYDRSDFTTDRTNKGDMYNILYYASLSGSSHNSQPWRVEVYKEDSILVFTDSLRKLNVIDPKEREFYISIGAFIENLNLAAGSYGYNTEIRINNAVTDKNIPTATIKLSKCKKTDFQISDIEKRRTLHTAFDTTEIKGNDLEALIKSAPENIHYAPSSFINGKYVKKNTINSYAQQAKNKEAQDELAKWFRFSNRDVKEKRDGLTTSGLDLNGLSGFVVRNFFNPEDSKKESFVNKAIEKTQMQAENCAGWIIITQPKNDIEAWINSGRLYQRVNLKCRKLSLGFQPMNQMIEEKNYESEANSFLDYKGTIHFVARIGYVKDYPDPVSVRRPVESFTTFK
jgi:hypothetical protein